VKFSTKREDASFMKDILKNYLEVYLVNKSDKSHYFTLVYDFEPASGYLKKLLAKKEDVVLDKSSEKHWIQVVDKIKKDYPSWNWKDFNINDLYPMLFRTF